jgi:hypothetical protein
MDTSNWENTMYERGHENSYRVAFRTANADLTEVFREMDQLRVRKERIDKLIESLKPLLGGQPVERQVMSSSFAPAPSQESSQRSAEPAPAAAQAAEPAPAPEYQEEEVQADPIQSRINSILGLAVA